MGQIALLVAQRYKYKSLVLLVAPLPSMGDPWCLPQTLPTPPPKGGSRACKIVLTTSVIKKKMIFFPGSVFCGGYRTEAFR